MHRAQVLQACVFRREFRVENERPAVRVAVAAVLDHADRQTEVVINRPHRLHADLAQVVVGRDQMRALAQQRVQVERQRRGQRLAFTRFHFGDASFVQHDAADQLHVEMALSNRAHGGFANQRVGFRQQVVQRFAVGDLALEFRRLRPHFLRRQLFASRVQTH